jgi:hypothetical protein
MPPDRARKVPWQRFSANAGSKLLEFADAAASCVRFKCLEALQALAISNITLVEAVLREGKWP